MTARIHPGLAALAAVAALTALLLILQSAERTPAILEAPRPEAPVIQPQTKQAPAVAPHVTVIQAPQQSVPAPGASAHIGDLPDPRLTPGLADPSLTKDVLCAPGFTTATIRNVPSTRKKAIYKLYGIEPIEPPCPCEIDHLIPLELGGSNEPSNLWPQSQMTQPWNARVKDRLEKRLHAEVCSAKIELEAGQHEIASNWMAAYIERFGQPK